MREINARVILGDEFFEGLRDFYRSIRESKYQYKICLPRRCFVLGRIFMELDGESETTFDEKGCMTDSAVLSLCYEIAISFINNGKFPSILVCDDILIHGRAMNAFLVKLENRIIQCLVELGCKLSYVEMRTKLIFAIDIWVYMKSSKSSLMLSRYLARIKAVNISDPVIWRDLSNRISVLICESGAANANFILSSVVTYKEFSGRQGGYTKVETVYRKNKEISYIEPLNFGTGIKAILSVRMNATPEMKKKRIIPFVFLPHLQKGEREILLQAIEKKLPNERFCQIVNRWKNRSDRICSEFISLVLSQNVLLSFMQEYELREILDDVDVEISKISHNYGNSTDVCDLIKYIKKNKLFSKEELIELIKTVTEQAEPICESTDYHILTEETSNKLLGVMEDIISEVGWQSEKEAYELWADSYIPTKLQYKETRMGIFDYIDKVREHAEGFFSLYYVMAYALQFMDAGLMVVSVYKADEQDGEYAQYCKAGEQSITVQQRRNYKYIPLLVAINRRCIGSGLSVQEELDDYISQYSISDDDRQKMLDLLRRIKEADQSVDDWDFLMQECTNDMETDDMDERISELIRRNYEIIDEQKKHVMQYTS